MKGVSTILATLLMIIITVALGGVIYAYLSGAIESEQAVVLNVDNIECAGNTITLEVRNQGTSPSGAITASVRDPSGATIAATCNPAISTINAGGTATCTITKTGPAGNYRVTLSAASGKSIRPTVFCAS
jgi:FlaG/FlaF family flagellin (archaellin)